MIYLELRETAWGTLSSKYPFSVFLKEISPKKYPLFPDFKDFLFLLNTET